MLHISYDDSNLHHTLSCALSCGFRLLTQLAIKFQIKSSILNTILTLCFLCNHHEISPVQGSFRVSFIAMQLVDCSLTLFSLLDLHKTDNKTSRISKEALISAAVGGTVFVILLVLLFLCVRKYCL